MYFIACLHSPGYVGAPDIISTSGAHGSDYQVAPAGARTVVLIRLNMLVSAIISTIADSSFSPKCSLAGDQISPLTEVGLSASRVAASAISSAARSASLNRSESRHAATWCSRSSVSPFFSADLMPPNTHGEQPLIWLARRCTSSSVLPSAPDCAIAL